MEEKKNDIIIQRVMETFRSSLMVDLDTMTFSLQLLYWAKISQEGKLDEAFNIQQPAYIDPKQIMTVWQYLANKSNTLCEAYSNLEIFSRLSAPCVGAAVNQCIRLAETGALTNFDPTDCLTLFAGRDTGEMSLPSELADLMTHIARIESKSTVYTPWDNSIQMAVRATRLGATVYMEIRQRPMLSALISLFVDGQIDIVQGDPIREPSAVEGGKLRKFDTCLSFPPINVRYTPDVFERDLYGRFKEFTKSGTVLAVRHIMAQTKGRAVIGVHNGLLFSPGSERSLRDELIEKKFVESVIAMPSGILPYTNISFALLVLNMKEPQHTVRFVNAEADCFHEAISRARARAKLTDIDGIVARATGVLEDEYVVKVKTEGIIKNDSMLQVNRYVIGESTQKITKLMASSQTQKLENFVSILRPIPRPPVNKGLIVLEVGTADLQEFAYIAPPVKEVRLDIATAQRNENLFLKPFDIVITVKGSVGRVGIAPEDVPPPGEGGWIVGQAAVILRVTNRKIMHPKALAVYLRSPLGQAMLGGLALGATIPLIQQRELQQLPVVVPAMEEVAGICDILDKQASIKEEIDGLKAQLVELSKRIWALD